MRTEPFKFQTVELTPLQRLAQDMIAGRTELTPEEQQTVAREGVNALENEMKRIKGIADEQPAAKPETPAPDKPEEKKKTVWEQYQLIIILVAVIAVVVFFWKFKIVSKAAAAVITA